MAQREFKNSAKTDDSSRQSRVDTEVQLRKNKRIDQALKRRNISLADEEGRGHHDVFDTDAPAAVPQDVEEELQHVGVGLHTANEDAISDALARLRFLLTQSAHPPIQAVIDIGLLPRLVQLMDSSNAHIQKEATWVMVNVSSGSSAQTQAVVDSGAVDTLVRLLSRTPDDTREQALWALGNIAADSPQARDYVIERGCLTPLLRVYEESRSAPLLRNATWTLSNLCRGRKPPPNFEIVSAAIPYLSRLLYSEDKIVVSGSADRLEAVVRSGACKRLVELLLNPAAEIVTACLRTLGHIAAGTDIQTQVVINCLALKNIRLLLDSGKELVFLRELCYLVSNLTAGTRHQIQSVIASGVLPYLTHVMLTADHRTKIEAAWAVSNAVLGAAYEQLESIITAEIIRGFCELLAVHDPEIQKVSASVLSKVLKYGNDAAVIARHQCDGNAFAPFVEEYHGTEQLEVLLSSENPELGQLAVEILDEYFAKPPGIGATAASSFSFRPTPPPASGLCAACLSIIIDHVSGFAL